MSPLLFWKITPRKLNALIKVHSDLNSTEEDKAKTEVNAQELRDTYLRNKGLGNVRSYGIKGMQVPEPTHYVDQLSFMK